MATGIEMAVAMAAKMAGIEPEQLKAAILRGIETIQAGERKLSEFDIRLLAIEEKLEKILHVLQNESVDDTADVIDALKLNQ